MKKSFTGNCARKSDRKIDAKICPRGVQSFDRGSSAKKSFQCYFACKDFEPVNFNELTQQQILAIFSFSIICRTDYSKDNTFGCQD